MRIGAFAVLLIPFLAHAQATLTGSIVDATGAYIAKATVEIDTGTKRYQVQTDDAGAYQFTNLPSGKYSLTFTKDFFVLLTVSSIELSERESKRIPEITLIFDLSCPSPPTRFVRVTPEAIFGELSGSVIPSAPGIDVLLICRTFRQCGSTKTDSNGRFSFQKLTAGPYGLSFRRDGFFDQDATVYEYYVNAGLESVYSPIRLEQCPDGNCKAKIQRVLPSCA